MKSATFPNSSPSAIKRSMNDTANLIHPKSLFNINTVFQQQQLRHQHLIQQQLLKLQLHQENQQSTNNYQLVSPTSSPINYLNNQPLDQANSMQSTFVQSPLSTSNSSTMELPIVDQNMQYCSSVNTSCENSLIISPVSTPPNSGSPISCSSPVTTTSSPLPVQSINPPIATFIPNIEQYQSINQLFNHEIKPSKINLLNKNKIDQALTLVDNQAQKKGKRKSNPKVKSSNKLDIKMDIYTSKLNDKLKQKAKQRSAANERERKRMSSINRAFDTLKLKLIKEDNVKLTKMEILKLAQNYIIELTKEISLISN